METHLNEITQSIGLIKLSKSNPMHFHSEALCPLNLITFPRGFGCKWMLAMITLNSCSLPPLKASTVWVTAASSSARQGQGEDTPRTSFK